MMEDKTFIHEQITNAIKAGIKKKNINQSDLAKLIGVERAVMSHYLTGRSIPPGDKLVNMINILGIAEDIFGVKNEQKSSIDEQKRKMDEAISTIEETIRRYKTGAGRAR